MPRFRFRPQKTPTIGLWMALFLLVAICLTSLFFLYRFRQENRLVQQTSMVQLQLDDTLALLQDAETGQRGYLLTQQTSYLQPYRRATGQIQDNIEQLRVLTRSNPRQQASLERLQPLTQAKLVEMQKTIDLRDTKGLPAAVQVVLTGRGQQLMEAIRRVIGTMKIEEEARLDEQQERANTTAQLATVVVLGGSSLLFALVALATVSIQRHLLARRQTAQERERHLEEIQDLNRRLQRAMSETHHRIKNNLQVVSALLEMQQDTHGDTVPSTELERLQKLVGGLAVIHDLLTQQSKTESDMEYLSARAALDRLLPLLQATYPDHPIRSDVQDVRLPVREGTSLAILVSELVSNAAKHGKGAIALSFSARNGAARLEVCDEGQGFPSGFDSQVSAHTGLDLIESVARWDLRGDIAYQTRQEGGARVVVTFPIPAALPPISLTHN